MCNHDVVCAHGNLLKYDCINAADMGIFDTLQHETCDMNTFRSGEFLVLLAILHTTVITE